MLKFKFAESADGELKKLLREVVHKAVDEAIQKIGVDNLRKTSMFASSNKGRSNEV